MDFKLDLYIYIYKIYISDITVKGKAVHSLCFLLHVISAGNQNVFTYSPTTGTRKQYVCTLSATGIDSGGPGVTPPEQASDLAQTVYA